MVMVARFRCESILFAVAVAVAAGCSDDGNNMPDASGPVDALGSVFDAPGSGIDGPTGDSAPGRDASPGVFTLSSTAIVDGGTFPIEHTCQGPNISPPLQWSNPPADALSYAIVFTDLSNGLIHSVIWDIPENLSSLPIDVDKVYEPNDVPGAKQTLAYNPNVRGYLGPCPPNEHTYQFEIYAIGVATLPGVDFDSTRQDLVEALSGQVLETAHLTASHDPNP